MELDRKFQFRGQLETIEKSLEYEYGPLTSMTEDFQWEVELKFGSNGITRKEKILRKGKRETDNKFRYQGVRKKGGYIIRILLDYFRYLGEGYNLCEYFETYIKVS